MPVPRWLQRRLSEGAREPREYPLPSATAQALFVQHVDHPIYGLVALEADVAHDALMLKAPIRTVTGPATKRPAGQPGGPELEGTQY